jgi:STE24 endopeptidase
MVGPDKIFLFIVIIISFNFVLEVILEYVEQNNFKEKMPEEAKGIYDEEKYKKARMYHKAQFIPGILSSGINFIILIIVLLAGGFAVLDDWANSIVSHPIYTSLIYFGIIFIVADIISLPFSLYNTFVIEEKFGFNKSTLKLWVFDKLKGLVLSIILGGGILSLIIWFYSMAGNYFWLYSFGIIAFFMIFFSMFYTSLIVPMFNKLTPLENGELKTAIEEYCKKVNFKLKNVFVIDGSKRSTKANAYFSGLGPNKKIVLYDTLIKNHTTEELVAVLAHEVGHYKRKHTLWGMLFGLTQTGIMLYLLSAFINEPVFANAIGVAEPNFHIGVIVFGILYTPLSIITGLLMNSYSRKNEYEADAYAKQTFKGQYLSDALKKLSVDNLSNPKPHPLYVFFHYSHPTLLNRMKAIEN